MIESVVDKLLPRVVEDLNQQGYSKTNAISFDEYIELGKRLGSILYQSEVKIIPGQMNYVAQAGSIPFHTDDLTAEVVSWYCQTQDEGDGSSLLLDSSKIDRYFSEEELAKLGRITLGSRPAASAVADMKKRQFPLILKTEKGYRLYYIPWLIIPSEDESQARLIARFKEFIENLEKGGPIRLRLNKGEALFINNGRMLHGRDAIAGDSARHLTRLWIGKSESEANFLVSANA